jgi:ferredoxin
MPKYIDVDTDACVACGTCVDICPNVFQFNESNLTVSVMEQYSVSEDELEEAIQSCPAHCISWVRQDCVRCETCSILCSEAFTFNENEQAAEVILPAGSLEDCLEDMSELFKEECIE